MRWKQGLCVALALATACGTTIGLAQAAVNEPSSPEISVPVETRSPRSPNNTMAPVSVQSSSQGFYILFRAQQLDTGAEIELYSSNRVLLQQLFVDSNHEAVSNRLMPGNYLVYHKQIGFVQISVHDNASVSVLGGNGWSDGEIIYLSSLDTGTLRILCYIPISAVDSEEGYTCTYSLLGENYASDRILHFTAEAEQVGRYYVMPCIFAGLPEGSFSLLENGQPNQTIVITADEQESSIVRYPELS